MHENTPSGVGSGGMVLAQVLSGAVLGVEAYLVRVEVDLAPGLPCMQVVGLPESAVREGRERVVAALHNAGYRIPPRRITVNLAPADVRKEGSAFDLPLALGMLAASGAVPEGAMAQTCFVGELGLDGEVRAVRGVLPLAIRCREEGLSRLVVPAANAREAAVVDSLAVLPVDSLGGLVRHLQGKKELPAATAEVPAAQETAAWFDLDYADVKGQELAKRALEIAAAGQHNVLMVGPPGSGKSMLARRLPGILPPLSPPEALDLTRVYSVAGRLRPGEGLLRKRPFRAPHHSISDAGIVGGGSIPRPGEASLAHHGVLFLDELPEFRRPVLESLRQPLEDGAIQLGRARMSVTYPARFMLVAAMNPCPCGFFGAGEGTCICRAGQIRRYMGRVSGPLLDRIDLHVVVPAVNEAALRSRGAGESSSDIRRRVLAARQGQAERFRNTPGIFANSQMGPRQLRESCRLDRLSESLLGSAITRLGLSARAYHRVLRLARTIADLQGTARIQPGQVAEAIQYRSVDRLALRVGGASRSGQS